MIQDAFNFDECPSNLLGACIKCNACGNFSIKEIEKPSIISGYYITYGDVIGKCPCGEGQLLNYTMENQFGSVKGYKQMTNCIKCAEIMALRDKARSEFSKNYPEYSGYVAYNATVDRYGPIVWHVATHHTEEELTNIKIVLSTCKSNAKGIATGFMKWLRKRLKYVSIGYAEVLIDAVLADYVNLKKYWSEDMKKELEERRLYGDQEMRDLNKYLNKTHPYTRSE